MGLEETSDINFILQQATLQLAFCGPRDEVKILTTTYVTSSWPAKFQTGGASRLSLHLVLGSELRAPEVETRSNAYVGAPHLTHVQPQACSDKVCINITALRAAVGVKIGDLSTQSLPLYKCGYGSVITKKHILHQ